MQTSELYAAELNVSQAAGESAGVEDDHRRETESERQPEQSIATTVDFISTAPFGATLNPFLQRPGKSSVSSRLVCLYDVSHDC